MKYPLQETDLILIKGAITLGDNLKTMPEATSEDIANIEKFQEVLKRLPEATPNVMADYGFGVMKLEMEFSGVNRWWGVSTQRNPNGLIEIYSCYTIVPYRDEELEREKEYYFTFSLTNTFLYSPKYFLEWIEEVKNPNRWRNEEQDFEIDADFQIISDEIGKPI